MKDECQRTVERNSFRSSRLKSRTGCGDKDSFFLPLFLSTSEKSSPVLAVVWGTDQNKHGPCIVGAQGTLRRLSSPPPSEQADGTNAEEDKGGRFGSRGERNIVECEVVPYVSGVAIVELEVYGRR